MYTLTFTEEQMAVLDRALQDAPFRLAAPIVQSINDQIRKAQQAELGRMASNVKEIDVTDLKPA